MGRCPANLRRQRRRRSGLTLLELIVSATLFIGLISIAIPLTVRATRLWQDARCYRLAINELSNQLEDLTVLGDQERQQLLSDWKPSDELLHTLPAAKLTGETIDDADGKRLKLSLSWRRGLDAQPVTMVGWLHPERQ